MEHELLSGGDLHWSGGDLSPAALSDDEDFGDFPGCFIEQPGDFTSRTQQPLQSHQLPPHSHSYCATVKLEENDVVGSSHMSMNEHSEYERKTPSHHSHFHQPHCVLAQQQQHQQLGRSSDDAPRHQSWSNLSGICKSTGNGECGGGQQMELYRDLILRHLIQDISTTCAKLHLPTDARYWSPVETGRWIAETCAQFGLSPPRVTCVAGKQLLSASQCELDNMAPGAGETLFTQLQLWKTAFESYQQDERAGMLSSGSMTAADNCIPKAWNTDGTPTAAPTTVPQSEMMGEAEMKMHDQQQQAFLMQQHQHRMNPSAGYPPHHPRQDGHLSYYSNGPMAPLQNHQMHQMNMTADASSFYTNNCMISSSPTDSESSGDELDDEDGGDELRCAQPLPPAMAMHHEQPAFLPGQLPTIKMEVPCFQPPGGNGSRHSGSVHLWHFIRELLDQPKQYGSCVRWVDREQGTFKIESSQSLARFWGSRKNRSQMNYDKLSRSLRQYYKKGIIQKPEKKQRLVYKFLPPYHL